MQKTKYLLLLLFLLTACGKEDVELYKNCISDETFYITSQSISDLSEAIDTANCQLSEIVGEYDLNKAGEYQVKVIYFDHAGQKIIENKTLIVNDKEISNDSKRDDEVQIGISQNQNVEKNDSSKEMANQQAATDVEVQNNEPTPSISATLESNDWRIKKAFELEGESGGCEYLAYRYLESINMTNGDELSVDYEEINAPFLGSLVKYYDETDNYKHTAVYLMDDWCLHGNYTSDGKAKIAPCKLYSKQRYFDPTTIVKKESDLINPEKSPAYEFYANDIKNYRKEMCEVPFSTIDDNASLAYWCMDYHYDSIIWE